MTNFYLMCIKYVNEREKYEARIKKRLKYFDLSLCQKKYWKIGFF